MNRLIHNSPALMQRGFTIVEIMISMLLGIILLVGVVSLMVGNKRSFNEQTETSRLQENARLAIQYLIQDIRMAGYTGCNDDIANVTNDLNGAADDDNLLSMQNAVEGVDSASSPKVWEASGSSDIIANMTAGTDGISIRYMTPSGITIEAPYMNTNASALHVSAGNGLVQGEILAVSDCTSADIFQISNANPDGSGTISHNTGSVVSPSNATGDLSKTYGADAELLRMISARYYVGDLDADGVSSLYRHTHDADRDDSDGDGDTTERIEVSLELIEGVENMQILYGNGATFVSADNIAAADWAAVDSVKIALLLRTVDEMGSDTDATTYSLLGTTVNPADLRVRRRVYNATIEIRNR